MTPTATDVQNLATQSAIVIEASITPNATATARHLATGSSALALDETPVTAVKVLANRANTPTPTAITGTGFSWSHTLEPGRYVFFLLPDDQPTMGMYGIFNISGTSVVRRCPNYQTPGTYRTATGAPLSVASFEALIPRQLPLPQIAPPKMGSSIPASPAA